MNQNLKNIFLAIGAIIITVVFSTPLGNLYELIVNRKVSGWFWGPSNPLAVNGFFIGLAFIFPLLLSFGGKNKWYYIVTLFVVYFLFFLGNGEALILDCSFYIFGLVLGLLLNQAYLKFLEKS